MHYHQPIQSSIIPVHMFSAVGVVRCHELWRADYKGPVESGKEGLLADM